MLSTSFEFRNQISQNTKTLFKATLTLKNRKVVELTGDDIMMGSPQFSDGVSSSNTFDVGAAIMNQFKVTLNNFDERFNEFDFTDSVIVPYVGLELSDGKVEWLCKGHYGVDRPSSYGHTISLTALDNMRLFEVPYAKVSTKYPATLRTIVDDICKYCGVTLGTSTFANDSYSIRIRPDDKALTCLDVISFVAQIAGCYARIDTGGRLTIDWYNTKAFEAEDWLDGKFFDDGKPYQSGDTADGGNFTDYSSGDKVDGGAFGNNAYAYVHAISSMSVFTDDIVITGIRVTAQEELVESGQGADGETSLWGKDGYVLDISGNPFILYGQASTVAKMIGERVVGMQLRPFTINALGDPSLEAGDPILFVDDQQRMYKSYITNLTYKVGSYESFSCGAETPSRNSASGFSSLTRAVVDARNALKKEQTAREEAMKELNRQLEESSGMYMTSEKQPDGSTIYYMHDKPTLNQSKIVWKYTAEAFGVSTDGGATYPYGFSADGDTLLNRIYAIGLDASYINTGRIVVSKDKKVLFSADINTGEVYFQDVEGYNYWNLLTGEFKLSPNAQIGDRTVADYVDELAAGVLDDFIQNTYADDIEEIRDQIDQKVETWYQSNDPSSSWTTSAIKKEHKGDIWFDPTTKVAKVYDGTKWQDMDIDPPQEVFDKIDGKCQVFISTPQPPYHIGDLWFQSSTSDILTCVVNRTVGSYVSTDWQKRNKYIDKATADTIAADAVDSLTTTDIFNLLTNNGTIKGLFMQNGQLFFNGDYVRTGRVDSENGSYWDLVKGGAEYITVLSSTRVSSNSSYTRYKEDVLVTRLGDADIPIWIEQTSRYKDVYTTGEIRFSEISTSSDKTLFTVTQSADTDSNGHYYGLAGTQRIVSLGQGNGKHIDLVGNVYGWDFVRSGNKVVSVQYITNGAQFYRNSDSYLSLTNSSARLQALSGVYMLMQSDQIRLQRTDNHYIYLTPTSGYFRLGNNGGGYYNGDFRALSWS